MIQHDEIASLIDYAREYPRRVGDMLGNYRIVLAQWEEYDPDELRKLLTLTWNRLDMATRRQFIHLMMRMIYRVSKSDISMRGVQSGEVTISPFNFQGDEIALDRTLERMTESPVLSLEDIFILDRKRRKKAAVLMMDASGSMQGENLSMAAIAVASLAMNLDFGDEYGVVLFSEMANIFKRIDQALPLDEVICGVLDILPEGRTNVSLGLSTGLREIRRSRVEQRIGILLTDGWQNVGHDPVSIAGKFPKLHVINLPRGDPELAERIATVGRGRFVALTDMLDVPKAVAACLE